MTAIVTYEPKAGDRLECAEGSLCCWQIWDGVEPLHETADRHALVRLSEREPPPPPTCNGCGCETSSSACTACATPLLAKALFRTDPRVQAFVGLVADSVCAPGEPETWDVDLDRIERAWETAWARNERGWRTEMTRRAQAMVDLIRALPLRSGA